MRFIAMLLTAEPSARKHRNCRCRAPRKRRITVRSHTDIVALEGNGHLERLSWRNRQNGLTETHRIHHLFSMTGANPNTGWLGGCVALDDKQFVRTLISCLRI